jgi:low affinity Fe/Cu permease
MKEIFRKIANTISNAAGSAWAFCLAFLIIVIWATTGPLFDFSDTWQLVINTGTTIVTFLMVFLIQNTQNRDSKAMQLKLDELIRATRARDTFIDIEDLNDDELASIAKQFKSLHDDTSDPAIKKFHSKLDDMLNKRHSLPGEDMANEVVSRLNPFGNHDNPHKHNK